MTPAEREYLQRTYKVTEADDAELCQIWFDDLTLTDKQRDQVYLDFCGKWGHWPIVGRKREGVA